MAEVMKKRRLVNPRRRNLSKKQIKYFGTARQKAALRRNRSRRRNQGGGGIVSTAERAAQRAIESVEHAAEDAIGAVTHAVNRGRRPNVGEILTVLPANPGRRKHKGRRTKNMAATKRTRASNRRHNRTKNRTRNARRHNPARMHNRRRHRHHNPHVVVRYRTRPRRHNRGRRRNQGRFLSGDAGKVVSVLGGALVTSTLTGFLPSNLTTGPVGWLTTGVAAVVGGTIVGKVSKNPALGNWFTVGGLVIVGLQIVQQFFPQLALPFTVGGTAAGTSGMGLITGSNFYVPQVNQPGSMASFYLPAAIPTPVVAPSGGGTGLGQYQRSMRRVGRLR